MIIRCEQEGLRIDVFLSEQVETLSRSGAGQLAEKGKILVGGKPVKKNYKTHVMAGKGRDRQIDCIDWLVDKHGGNPVEWTKEKGFGYVEDEYGETHRVELHWYQEPTVGKVEMKIKDRDGEIYLDD